ncbi:HAD family hydrolase [Streptomyces sp. NBC_00582]|uniref:HAD family hydrolase n=1 Tax=Streptomyces sp. NBC_00582 TaxID=2975783 RepID=UPI002E81D675|nr:HAD family hydrolase [Streptomyces sp. NBC_00582]WUB60049.1 HAD family hydrolase [Streptomyces sp. NBC_00582]
MPVLFFDIGATLADAEVDADGSLTLRPRPRVPAVLDAFREVRKGILSDPGPGEDAAARAAAALHSAFPGRFTDAALVLWGAKDSPDIFRRAVAATARDGGPALPADACVFVGENPRERAFAAQVGLRTAVDPVFTLAAVEGRPVFRARVELPAGQGPADLDEVAATTEAVPLPGDGTPLVPALLSELGAGVLDRAGFGVDLRDPLPLA